jgi:hypothetical protein
MKMGREEAEKGPQEWRKKQTGSRLALCIVFVETLRILNVAVVTFNVALLTANIIVQSVQRPVTDTTQECLKVRRRFALKSI